MTDATTPRVTDDTLVTLAMSASIWCEVSSAPYYAAVCDDLRDARAQLKTVLDREAAKDAEIERLTEQYRAADEFCAAADALDQARKP